LRWLLESGELVGNISLLLLRKLVVFVFDQNFIPSNAQGLEQEVGSGLADQVGLLALQKLTPFQFKVSSVLILNLLDVE
jgi:hypothetical protein